MNDASPYMSLKSKSSPDGVLDLSDFDTIEGHVFDSEDELSKSVEGLRLSPLHEEVNLEEDNFECDSPDRTITATLLQIDSLVKDLGENDTAVDKDALFSAASEGNAECILRLMEAGVCVSERRDADGASALHVAASAGHERAVTALVLLAARDLLNAVDRCQRTALHCAALQGHQPVALRLLIAGARLDLKDNNGDTPLLVAAKAGHWGVVALLAEKGVLVLPGRLIADDPKAEKPPAASSILNERDRDGNSAMVHAARASHWGVVQLLLEKGASPREYQSAEGSPLALAAIDGRHDMVEALIRHGASPAHVEDAMRRREVVDRGRRLRCAAQNGLLDALALTLAAGCDVDAATDKGRTALHFACHYGRVECAAFLVRRGACIDARDCEGCTPLHHAAYQGHEGSVGVLLGAGAHVDAVDDRGSTALHWACYNGHAAAAQTLLLFGARTDLQDSNGRTPLHDASQHSHAEIVSALLQAGADVTAKNKHLQTPMHVAKTDEVKSLLGRAEVQGIGKK